jgi:hypothetical protein
MDDWGFGIWVVPVALSAALCCVAAHFNLADRVGPKQFIVFCWSVAGSGLVWWRSWSQFTSDRPINGISLASPIAIRWRCKPNLGLSASRSITNLLWNALSTTRGWLGSLRMTARCLWKYENTVDHENDNYR